MSSTTVRGSKVSLVGIAGVVSPATIRKVCRVLGDLAQSNPCGGQWVTTLDKTMGYTVGLEPVAALASRIWDALGGNKEFSRSMRMDGTQATFSEAWAK